MDHIVPAMWPPQCLVTECQGCGMVRVSQSGEGQRQGQEKPARLQRYQGAARRGIKYRAVCFWRFLFGFGGVRKLGSREHKWIAGSGKVEGSKAESVRAGQHCQAARVCSMRTSCLRRASCKPSASSVPTHAVACIRSGAAGGRSAVDGRCGGMQRAGTWVQCGVLWRGGSCCRMPSKIKCSLQRPGWPAIE